MYKIVRGFLYDFAPFHRGRGKITALFRHFFYGQMREKVRKM